METCKNCGHKFQGKYCNNCGQDAHTHPINGHYIWHDIQHGLLHIHSGFFYTAAQLFIRPGRSIRGFINGQRARHFGPISMLIVVATLYGFIYHSIHLNLFKYAKNDFLDYDKLNEWIATHYAFVTLFTVPFYSLFSYLIFKKQGYNYFEHIVLNCYLGAQRLSLRILALPLELFAHRQSDFNFISGVLTVLDIVLLYRGYGQFFNQMSRGKAFLLTTLSYLLAITTIGIAMCFIIAIMVV